MTKCEKCGAKCCVEHIGVHPREILFDNIYLTKPSLQREHIREMRVDAHGYCICLVNGKCSIYESRPLECRVFKLDSDCCKALRSGKRYKHNCTICAVTEEVKKNV